MKLRVGLLVAFVCVSCVYAWPRIVTSRAADSPVVSERGRHGMVSVVCHSALAR
jgi:hypothetical protein